MLQDLRSDRAELDASAVAIRLLTRREIDCLAWSADGKTSWEIGEILGVSEHTVTSHLRNAGNKLAAMNRTHAVAQALWRGMIR